VDAVVTIYAGDWVITGPDPAALIPLDDILLRWRAHRGR
jgi:hypothetical protein